MKNLELVTTERFGDLDCHFYRDSFDEILLTREQIGSALEYSNPDVALSIIHKKHKDRLDEFSTVIKLISVDGKKRDTILYTQRGIMEICRWSRQEKANEFMDWVWDIIENYRKGTLDIYQNKELLNVFNNLNATLENFNERLSKIEENKHTTSTPIKKYSHWKKKAFQKLNALTDYANDNSTETLSLSNTMNIIFNQMQDMYDIDLPEYSEMYRLEFSVCSNERVHTLDVISYYKDLRDMFDSIIDDLLDEFNISTDTTNIFDDLIKKNKFKCRSN